MRKCKFITWCTTSKGIFGMGVFENEAGEREIRGSIVDGDNMETDIKFIDEWGGLISSEMLLKLVAMQNI